MNWLWRILHRIAPCRPEDDNATRARVDAVLAEKQASSLQRKKASRDLESITATARQVARIMGDTGADRR